MMSDPQDPYYVFNQIKKGLNRINNVISPNSVRLRQEQTELLADWQEMRWGLLYHSSSDLQYDNSTNLFGLELESNRQYLRHNGFELLDYKQELSQFIIDLIKPLHTHIQKVLIILEQEIEINSERMPVKPNGLANITNDVYHEAFHSVQYENFLKQYIIWEQVHIEALDYESKLRSLDSDLKIIEQTIEKYFFFNGGLDFEQRSSVEADQASTAPTSSEPKLTHAQIALLYHYNDWPITDNNATIIAAKYGQTSGRKLMQHYTGLVSPLIRTARGKYTVHNIEVVLFLLSGESLKIAEKELVDAKMNNQKKF